MRYAINLICIALTVLFYASADAAMVIRGSGGGDELITNGTFDADCTGWIMATATCSVTGGVGRITNGDGNDYIYQTLAYTEGNSYDWSMDLVDTVGGCRIDVLGNNSVVNTSTPGTYSGTVTAMSNPNVYIRITSSTVTDWCEVDNVSVSEN